MEHKLISVRKEIAFAGACPCSKQKQRKRMAVINAVELSHDDRIKNASRIGSGCAGSTEYKNTPPSPVPGSLILNPGH